ncbi:MAG: PAS domain S-box protein [Bacteroidales bacterium]|nr:PAS domain S-box protein [Bacteroidales bacterium]
MKTEAELRNIENSYKAIDNSSFTGIITCSLTGIILSANPSICRRSGYTENELIGKHFTKISPFRSKDIPYYIKLYENGLSGEFPEEPVEFMWKHKSGELRWAEGFLGTVIEDDKIVALQAFVVDITDRKSMEEKIRQDAEEKDFLFNVAQEMLLINELDDLFKFFADTLHEKLPGSYITVNQINADYTELTVIEIQGLSKTLRQTLKMIGIQLEGSVFKVDKNTFNYAKVGKLDFYNNSLFDLTMKQIPKAICQKVEKAAGIKKIYELSLGNRNIIEGGIAIITTKRSKDIPGQVIENFGRLASMSLNRIKAENNLKKSENNYRTLAENSPQLIIRADKELSVIYLNRSAREYIGNNSGIFDICNLHDGKIVSELSKIWCDKIHQSFHTGMEQTIELIEKSDKQFFDWLIVPEKDKYDNVVSLQIIGRDITREKINAARLIEDIETKNKIFSIIAHDLRGPFSSVSGFTELLSDNFNELSDSERNEYLRIIRDSSQAGFQLLDSLMEWSRTNRELNFVKSGYFNLHDVIINCLELYAPKTNMKNQKIINNISDTSIIYADYNIISTAIRNIFSNAIKFTPEGGVIELNLDHRADRDIIIIKDNGVGMSQEQLDNLSGMKELVISSKGTHNETGLGLGIRQTMEFLRKNNCSLSFISQKGKGTIAKIIIPKNQ